MPKDEPRAAALYKKACDASDMRGCAMLGSVYETGTGAPKDPVQASALYRRACAGGVQKACERSVR